MKLKILTANVAFGLKRMDNVFVNIFNHLVFHGWSMITFFTTPKSLRKHKNHLNLKRIFYVRKHSDLKSIIDLLDKEQPDVLMLNEVIEQLFSSELEKELRLLGYKSFSLGHSKHYADATVSSLVASKIEGEAVKIKFPEESHVSGGGGIAALRLSEHKITVANVHMCSTKFSWLYSAEVKAIAKFISEEKFAGREVVIGGDWNASTSFLNKYASFFKLNLQSAESDLPSCPTFLPKLKPLDHIFVPHGWKATKVKTVSFGSDHLAISVCVEKKPVL